MQTRKRKLIEPRLQLRFVATFLQLAGLAAMIQSLVVCYFLNRFADQLKHDGVLFRSELPYILGQSFLITFAVMVPMMLAIGIRRTFTVVGPMYRMRAYLEGLRHGTADRPCQVRKTDELQDFCELLNEVTAPLRAKADPEEPAHEVVRRSA